jgi:hypothetical protein
MSTKTRSRSEKHEAGDPVGQVPLGRVLRRGRGDGLGAWALPQLRAPGTSSIFVPALARSGGSAPLLRQAPEVLGGVPGGGVGRAGPTQRPRLLPRATEHPHFA